MKLHLTLGLATWLIAISALAMEYEVDETVAAAPDGLVMIDVPRGRAEIVGWERAEVRVSGRIDEETREFVFRSRGEETLIEVRLDRGGHWGSGDSDLQIRVPVGSEVEFKGVSLDVTVNDVKGGVKGGTVSGDLSLTSIDRRIDVGSVSGDITLRQCNGRLHVNSVSGDLDVRDSNGEGSYESVSGSIVVRGREQLEIEIETISGEIIVELEQFREFRAESVSGEIEIAGHLLDGGRVDLEAVSGRIDLALGGKVNAAFEVETGSGRIRNDLTDDEPSVARYSRNSELRFAMGDASGLVVVSTASGRVVLRPR